ncbi:hypothetical protein TrRE_jg8745, partial [Triparma retinervis]
MSLTNQKRAFIFLHLVLPLMSGIAGTAMAVLRDCADVCFVKEIADGHAQSVCSSCIFRVGTSDPYANFQMPFVLMFAVVAVIRFRTNNFDVDNTPMGQFKKAKEEMERGEKGEKGGKGGKGGEGG